MPCEFGKKGKVRERRVQAAVVQTFSFALGRRPALPRKLPFAPPLLLPPPRASPPAAPLPLPLPPLLLPRRAPPPPLAPRLPLPVAAEAEAVARWRCDGI